MADKCGKCEEPIVSKSTHSVKCSVCEAYFHSQCCKLSRTRGASQATWRCDSCKAEAASPHSESTTVIATLQVMRKEMADNMTESRERFSGLETAIENIRDAISDVGRRLKVLEEDNAKAKEECTANKLAIEKTSEEVFKLRTELIDLQQYMRRNNLEIKGIPYTTNENIYEVLEKLANVLEVTYHRDDFSVAHRLPTPRIGHPAIVAAFISRSVRTLWYAASRKKKISTTNISSRLDHGPVYINPHLTGYNKQLLGRARRLVRERKLAAAWTTAEGKVLVKPAEGQDPLRICLLEELDNILG